MICIFWTLNAEILDALKSNNLMKSQIVVDGRQHVFQIKGPPPQVEIGKKSRHDLVAGRVNLMLDAVNSITVYLDEKPQKIDLFGFPIVLRFGDGFHTVFLNGRPFPTNFGARLPFTVTTPAGRKHYLRFSALSPSTEKAMMHFIKAKVQIPQQIAQPPFNAPGPFRGGRPSMPTGMVRGGRGRHFIPRAQFAPRGGLLPDPPMMMNRFSFEENPLDVLANVLPSGDGRMGRENNHAGFNENNAAGMEVKDEGKKPAPQINVSELLAKLVQHGMLPPANKTEGMFVGFKKTDFE